MNKALLAKLMGWGQFAIVAFNEALQVNGGYLPTTKAAWLRLLSSFVMALAVHHASNTSADNPKGQPTVIKGLAILFVFLALSGATAAHAQSPTPTPIPQGTINFAANFSSFGSVATVNGNSNASATVFTMWAPITGNSGYLGNIAGRLDTVQLPGQSAQIYLLGLEKSWQGGKLLRLKSLTFDPNKYWVAAFAEVGGVKQDIVSPSVSARAGVVLRRQLTPTIGLNLGEFSYLRTDIGTATSAGHILFSGPNNWTAGAGVTVSFGATK